MAMNQFDLLAWVCASSGKAAMEIWQQCNLDKRPHYYTNTPEVKQFWKGRVGQATLWGCRVRWEIERSPERVRVLKWKATKLINRIKNNASFIRIR